MNSGQTISSLFDGDGLQGYAPWMILDTLEHAERYSAISPRIAAALKALRDDDLGGRPPGRYELDGPNLVAIVQTYQTKPADECIWETHRKYIDVQYVASGAEVMGHTDVANLKIKEAYDAQKDAAFYHPPADRSRASHVTVPAGSFVIFFPHDAHSPMIALGAPTRVLKIVMKVAV